MLALDLSLRSQASDWTETPASLSHPEEGHRGACCPQAGGGRPLRGRGKITHQAPTAYTGETLCPGCNWEPSTKAWGPWEHLTPCEAPDEVGEGQEGKHAPADLGEWPLRGMAPAEWPISWG